MYSLLVVPLQVITFCCRTKAADLANYILTKKDIGCTMARSVTVIEETKQIGMFGDEFWQLLGGNASYCCSGPAEEDELYESYISETNLVYRVEGEDLVPIEEYCGQVPRYDMLQDDQVIYNFTIISIKLLCKPLFLHTWKQMIDKHPFMAPTITCNHVYYNTFYLLCFSISFRFWFLISVLKFTPGAVNTPVLRRDEMDLN